MAVIEAVIVQVPASTKVTTPLEELIVQIDVVELEYDFVPAPADAVDVMVGGVALPVYDALYDPGSIVNVRDVAVIVKERDDDVASAYPAFAVIWDVIVHVPASTKVTAPDDELTVHTEVVELE